MFDVMYGSMIFSSVFAIGEMSEMGRYEVPRFKSLFGFGIGIVFALFHMCGMVFLLRAVLYIFVRK